MIGLRATPASDARRPDNLFGERVPSAAIGAVTSPLRLGVPALTTDVDRLTRHWQPHHDDAGGPATNGPGAAQSAAQPPKGTPGAARDTPGPVANPAGATANLAGALGTAGAAPANFAEVLGNAASAAASLAGAARDVAGARGDTRSGVRVRRALGGRKAAQRPSHHTATTHNVRHPRRGPRPTSLARLSA